MKFSERYGYQPVREQLQLESMDTPLRNGLWDCVRSIFPTSNRGNMHYSTERAAFCQKLWHRYFKQPTDTIDEYWSRNVQFIRDEFFNAQWFQAYDFLEFCASNLIAGAIRDRFMVNCNAVLEREKSGYRFISGEITPITSAQELSEIEEALHVAPEYQGVEAHLKAALQHLSNRKNPDYRNSVKESISAVESICQLVAGKKKTSLPQALNDLQKGVPIHPALKDAFNKLYGYTSDAKGIRHALIESSEPDFHEAKFMLVTCSAFVNYILGIRSLTPGDKRD